MKFSTTAALACLSGLVAGAPAATNPWNAPHLQKIFDGTTLTGWTQSKPGDWSVTDGAIHLNGKERGWIKYNQTVGDFRWIFKVRNAATAAGADHWPAVLFWGEAPAGDALDAIQFQPPVGYAWDYRPGHFGDYKAAKGSPGRFDKAQWSLCEIVADDKTGAASMACCQLAGTGTGTCATKQVVTSVDKTAGRVGPFALQAHNAGIQDEYKDIYLESPMVTKPGQFITA